MDIIELAKECGAVMNDGTSYCCLKDGSLAFTQKDLKEFRLRVINEYMSNPMVLVEYQCKISDLKLEIEISRQYANRFKQRIMELEGECTKLANRVDEESLKYNQALELAGERKIKIEYLNESHLIEMIDIKMARDRLILNLSNQLEDEKRRHHETSNALIAANQRLYVLSSEVNRSEKILIDALEAISDPNGEHPIFDREEYFCGMSFDRIYEEIAKEALDKVKAAGCSVSLSEHDRQVEIALLNTLLNKFCRSALPHCTISWDSFKKAILQEIKKREIASEDESQWV